MAFDVDTARRFIDERWEADVVPSLCDYIRIPNLSPAYDDAWEANGHMDAAVDLVRGWLEAHALDGMRVDVQRLPGRTPLIVVEVPAPGGTAPDGTVLMYGHVDKQPPMTGWRDGLGPFEPVRDGDRLYGRGGADDGYAAFASLTALAALREAGGTHPRVVIVIEASEESGSPDLPAHVDALGDRLGDVRLVVCLDSGCSTFDRLWVTTSLRGLVGSTLRVRVLEEGIHSGASGVVPSVFRVLRSLLSRVEDERTGAVLVPDMHVEVPAERVEQARVAGEVLGGEVVGGYPFVAGATPVVSDPAEAILARTWRPAVTVTGFEGLPSLADAGNVLQPEVAVRLSIRIPPRCDSAAAAGALERVLRADPPYGAAVEVDVSERADGWDAPPTAPWLGAAVEEASVAAFGQGAAWEGEGGSIPFMGMLGRRFPDAQFLVTGVLGPHTNAHGPNEFLHVEYAKRLTLAVGHVLSRF